MPGLLTLIFFFAGCGTLWPGTDPDKALALPSSTDISPTASVSAESPTSVLAETPEASAEVPSPEPVDSMDPEASSPTDTKNPSPEPSPPETGIIVKSGNELSSEEKQALLEELEKELDALFAEINDVSAEEEMEAQN